MSTPLDRIARSLGVAPAVHRVRRRSGLLGRASATTGSATTCARGPTPGTTGGATAGAGTTSAGRPGATGTATGTAATIATGDDREAEHGQHERGAKQILEFHDRRSPLNNP